VSEFSWWQWIGSTGLAVGGWWVGYRNALHRFYLDQQSKERLAARALYADLHRINRSLGPEANVFGLSCRGCNLNVRRFIGGRKPSLSSLPPPIRGSLRRAWTLTVLCTTLKVAAEKYHLVSDEQWKRRKVVRELAGQSPSEDASERDFLKWHVDQINAEAAVRDLSEQLQETLNVMKTDHGLARAAIEALMFRLTALAESKVPGFWDFDEEQLKGQNRGPSIITETAGGLPHSAAQPKRPGL